MRLSITGVQTDVDFSVHLDTFHILFYVPWYGRSREHYTVCVCVCVCVRACVRACVCV